MMRQMRQNTKIILWIVVVAFVTTIFAVWGMDLRTGSTNRDPNILGKVNGVTITSTQYRGALEQLTSQYRSMSPDGRLSYTQARMIEDQAWTNIVMAILTEQKIQELGITVSDEEVVNYLRTTPPPEIQQYFLNDEGQFDYQAYQAALNNPEADWTSLENLARQRIPRLKLNQYLSAQVHVSNAEVRRAFEEANTELTVRYVEFPFEGEDVGDYAPGDDEIEKYYQDNIDLYTEGEKATLDVVKIDIKPSSADKDDILYVLDRIRNQILGGEDFAVLAETYSEKPTASAGGNTDWISEGQRDPKVLAVLEALENGELSEPVEADNGFYLLKRLEKRTKEDGAPEFSAQEIFIKLEAGSATVDSINTLADDLLNRAQSVGLRAAAEEKQLEVITPKSILKNFPIEGLGFAPAVSDFAFSNDPGTLSRVLRDETRYYVCFLIERTPKTPTPIADVKESIVRTLIQNKKKNSANQRAETFYRRTGEIGFEEAANADQKEIFNPETSRASDGIEPFGPGSFFAKTALSLEEGGTSPPVEANGAFYVIELMKRSPFDQEEFQKNAPALGNRIFQEKLERFITYWYEELEENSKIEDYRGSF